MAYDISIPPRAVSPATTTNATLLTSSHDLSVLVDVANLSTGTISVRVGIDPSSTAAVHWKIFNTSVTAGDAIAGLGPYFLQSGDKVMCRVGSTGTVATFSVTGVRST